MSAQPGCLHPSSCLPETMEKKGLSSTVSNRTTSKRDPKSKGQKQTEAGSVTSTSDRIDSTVQDLPQLYTNHVFFQGRTIIFLLPSSAFLLFQTPPYDCYGPGWGVKIDENVCKNLEEKLHERIVKRFYGDKLPFAKDFGWVYQNQPKTFRTFYQCQLDKGWNVKEQEEIFFNQDSKPITTCFFTLITWLDEDKFWRYKIVGIRAFNEQIKAEEYYMQRFLQVNRKEDSDDPHNKKHWKIMGGELR